MKSSERVYSVVIEQTFPVFLVMTNTDKTEGKGVNRVERVCRRESTARRLAKGADVQGSDGKVTQSIAVVAKYQYHERIGQKLKSGTVFLVPGEMEQPSDVDLQVEKEIEAERREESKRAQLLQRMIEAGFTDEEVELLKRS